MKIVKTLPNGRVVHRDVTEGEFINDGWMKNGWAATTLQGQIATDYHLMDQTFNDHFKNVPTTELVKYPRQIQAWKDLPGGKRKYLKMTYGEYIQKGWRDNGWNINASNRRAVTPRVSAKVRRDALDKIKQQKWWYPKRSFDQAKQLQRWTFSDTVPKEETDRQIELLRDFDYIPNPAMKRYSERLYKYGSSKTNQWRKLANQPEFVKDIWWRTQRQLLDVDGHPMPNPVITREEARRVEEPRRSKGDTNSTYGWRWTTHSMHWNRYKFPRAWFQWRGY